MNTVVPAMKSIPEALSGAKRKRKGASKNLLRNDSGAYKICGGLLNSPQWTGENGRALSSSATNNSERRFSF